MKKLPKISTLLLILVGLSLGQSNAYAELGVDIDTVLINNPDDVTFPMTGEIQSAMDSNINRLP